MMWVKPVKLALAVLLLLLLRKLAWCLRWLWNYYHGGELPAPIPFLPRRSGDRFEAHMQRRVDAHPEESEEGTT